MNPNKQSIQCPYCHATMNVPVGIGQIRVSCVNPNCRGQFLYDTNPQYQAPYNQAPPPGSSGFRQPTGAGRERHDNRPYGAGYNYGNRPHNVRTSPRPKKKLTPIRLISYLLVCLFIVGGIVGVIVGISGGGGSKSSVGKQALKITDRYIDGEISASEALNSLTECENSLADSDDLEDKVIKADISNIKTAIFMAEQTSGMDYSGGTLLVRRNELAREIGERER